MDINRTKASLFLIALASMLVLATGVNGSALAAEKDKSTKITDQTSAKPDDSTEEKSSSQESHSGNSGSPSASSENTDMITQKSLKNLSKCQSGAAEDGDLTLPEVKGCYSQVFDQPQAKHDKTGGTENNGQSANGQEEQLLRSKPINDAKVTAMREGFPF
jgi:hypothetical protein